MSSLNGRVAIVTGAAQGIGAVYAKSLATAGAAVVATDVLDPTETAETVTRDGGQALALTTDVSDSAAVKQMVDATVEQFGRVDILVNNAAIFASLALKPFDAIPDEEWDAVMNVNVKGPFLCCRAVVPSMSR